MSQCQSINFDVQLFDDVAKAAEAEIEREDQERQNELKALLTNAFDDLIDDSYISDEDDRESNKSHNELEENSYWSNNEHENGANIDEQRASNESFKPMLPPKDYGKYITNDYNYKADSFQRELIIPNQKYSANIRQNLNIDSSEFNIQIDKFIPQSNQPSNINNYRNEYLIQNDNHNTNIIPIAFIDKNIDGSVVGKNIQDNNFVLSDFNNESYDFNPIDINSLKSNIEGIAMNGVNESQVNEYYMDDQQLISVWPEKHQHYEQQIDVANCSNEISPNRIQYKPTNQYKLDGVIDSNRLTQLEILNSGREKKILELNEELKNTEANLIREIRIHKHKITMLEDDRDGARESLQQCEQLLHESNNMNLKLDGEIKSKDIQLNVLKNENEKLLKKLVTSEATIEDLHSQLGNVESGESLSRMRLQHEAVAEAIKNKHDEEIYRLKQNLDQFTVNNKLKDDEITNLRRQINELVKTAETIQLERAENINRLTKNLHESQSQCKILLENNGDFEISKIKHQLQDLLASKSILEDHNKTLKNEIRDLKEQLILYENISAFPSLQIDPLTSSSFDDSNPKLNIKLSNGLNNSKDSNKMLSSLKMELERCLSLYRTKRQQAQTFKDELQFANQNMNELNTKLATQQIKIQQLENDISKYKNTDEISQADRLLISEKQEIINSLLIKVKDTEDKIDELKNHNICLQENISKIVSDNEFEKKNALEHCEEAMMVHHEMTSQRLVHELEEKYEVEIDTLKANILSLEKDLSDTKLLYIDCCHTKDNIEQTLSLKFNETLKNVTAKHQLEILDLQIQINELKKQVQNEELQNRDLLTQLTNYKSSAEQKERSLLEKNSIEMNSFKDKIIKYENDIKNKICEFKDLNEKYLASEKCNNWLENELANLKISILNIKEEQFKNEEIIKSLNKENADFIDELKKSKENNLALESTCKNSQNSLIDIERLTQEKADLLEKNDLLQKEILYLNEKIILNEDNAKKFNDRNDVMIENMELHESNKKLNEKILEFEAKIKIKDEAKQDFSKNRIMDLEKRLCQFEKKLDEKDEENIQLKLNLSTVERSLKESQMETVKVNEQVVLLNKQINALEKENMQVVKNYAEKLEASVKNNVLEINRLKSEKNKLSKKIKENEALNENKIKDIISARDALICQEREKVLCLADEHVEKEIEKLRSSLMQANNNHLNNEEIVQKLEYELKEVLIKLNVASTDNYQLEKECKNLHQQILNVSEERKFVELNLVKEIKSKDEELSLLNSQFEEVKEQYTLFYNESKRKIIQVENNIVDQNKLISEIEISRSKIKILELEKKQYENKLENLEKSSVTLRQMIDEREKEITVLKNDAQTFVNLRHNKEDFIHHQDHEKILNEMKQYYIQSVEKIKKDVMNHAFLTNKHMMESTKMNLQKERHLTAKRLRKYYLRCLHQLFNQYSNQFNGSVNEMMQVMEHMLDNTPSIDSAESTNTNNSLASSSNLRHLSVFESSTETVKDGLLQLSLMQNEYPKFNIVDMISPNLAHEHKKINDQLSLQKYNPIRKSSFPQTTQSKNNDFTDGLLNNLDSPDKIAINRYNSDQKFMLSPEELIITNLKKSHSSSNLMSSSNLSIKNDHLLKRDFKYTTVDEIFRDVSRNFKSHLADNDVSSAKELRLITGKDLYSINGDNCNRRSNKIKNSDKIDSKRSKNSGNNQQMNIISSRSNSEAKLNKNLELNSKKTFNK